MEQAVSGGLELELTKLIFEVCEIDDMEPSELAPDDDIFGEESPLGLDSIDALEIAISIQKRYNVRLDEEAKGLQVMRSVRTLADFVREKMQN